jgi:hypothetical protein
MYPNDFTHHQTFGKGSSLSLSRALMTNNRIAVENISVAFIIVYVFRLSRVKTRLFLSIKQKSRPTLRLNGFKIF